jgi:hypothetical protein
MKPYGIAGLFLLFTLSLLPVLTGDPLSGKSGNQCFDCHTSAKKLITITREIHRGKPETKSESEGEG